MILKGTEMYLCELLCLQLAGRVLAIPVTFFIAENRALLTGSCALNQKAFGCLKSPREEESATSSCFHIMYPGA